MPVFKIFTTYMRNFKILEIMLMHNWQMQATLENVVQLKPD